MEQTAINKSKQAEEFEIIFYRLSKLYDRMAEERKIITQQGQLLGELLEALKIEAARCRDMNVKTTKAFEKVAYNSAHYVAKELKEVVSNIVQNDFERWSCQLGNSASNFSRYVDESANRLRFNKFWHRVAFFLGAMSSAVVVSFFICIKFIH